MLLYPTCFFCMQESLLYHPAIPGVPKAPKDNPPGYR